MIFDQYDQGENNVIVMVQSLKCKEGSRALEPGNEEYVKKGKNQQNNHSERKRATYRKHENVTKKERRRGEEGTKKSPTQTPTPTANTRKVRQKRSGEE